MTPPLPLTADQRAILALTARVQELEAALPIGRCETCREWDSYTTGKHGWCDALKMTTMRQFGCTTYAPAPPAAGEETR